MCGTGIGMSIAANKFPGVYAALCHDTYSARRARKSNNAQVLTMGARVVGSQLALEVVDAWLESEFEGGGSLRRWQRWRNSRAARVRKLINDPFDAVDDMLGGLLAMFPGIVELTESGRGAVLARRSPRRVAVIVGGGSGHEPAFLGYLGQGLADAAAVGNVFASPAATPAVECARAVAGEDGVLFLYGNYEGDIMNFGMATELLADEGIDARTVLVTDDVVSAAPAAERRGVAGDAVVFKAAGARADEGGSAADVVAAAMHANARTRSVGVGLGPCTVPTAGRPTFELPDGEMDIGMGVHR